MLQLTVTYLKEGTFIGIPEGANSFANNDKNLVIS
jgi:hypothetical protein